jgi:carbamoyltransferase
MDMSYFNYCHGSTMTSTKFDRLFGKPGRAADALEIDAHYMDVAASIQSVLEEIMLRMANHVYDETKLDQLCLAGGVALNCVANGRLLREGPFKAIWIQPAAGDSGGSLGVAQFIWYQLLNNPRSPNPADSQRGSLLGPAFDQTSIIQFLDRVGATYETFPDDASLCGAVANLLANDKVVGWFQGRMEFGPRGLGARSILGDARSAQMQSTMNQKIKYRESFRPFAPSVLADQVESYFDVAAGLSSPYMLLVAPVVESKRLRETGGQVSSNPLDRVHNPRSSIPAVTHVDYSARIQTVDSQRHGVYHRLLESFASLTGTPVLINTSFNVRGEPIVCTPEQAYRCFMATDMDALVLERCVLLKEQQRRQQSTTDRNQYLSEFARD